jgi:hypothetical protein
LLVSIKTDGKDQFIQAFEKFLKDHQIVTMPDGEVLQVIIPQDFEKTFLQAEKSLPVPPESKSPGRYTFTYDGVQMEQVLQVYENLLGRKWVTSPLSDGSIKLQTERSLSKAEAIHALDLIFVFGGCRVVYVGDDSFKFVRL